MAKVNKAQALYDLYLEKKQKKYEEDIGNGYIAENDLEELELLDELKKLEKVRGPKIEGSGKIAGKRRHLKAEDPTKALKEKRAAVLKSVEHEDADSIVFEYTTTDTIFNSISIIDKLIAVALDKMESSGQLRRMTERANIIFSEEESKNYSNCYVFLNNIVQQVTQNEIVVIKLDHKFYKHFLKIKDEDKFRKYKFEVKHKTITEEPSIIEVSYA